MAMRSVLGRNLNFSRFVKIEPSMNIRSSRFSSGKVLDEEEKAAENVYIKKMEREKAEKMKIKLEKEKTQLEKETAEKKSDGAK